MSQLSHEPEHISFWVTYHAYDATNHGQSAYKI